MRVTNQNQPPVPSPDNNPEAAPTPRNDSSGYASPSLHSPTDSLEQSSELLGLTNTLQQVPPVRQEAVAEAVRRLASGELRSANALEQTARAILGM